MTSTSGRSTTITAVFFDADGVLQHPRVDFATEFERLGGPHAMERLFRAELPSLRGEGHFPDIVERELDAMGSTATAEDFLGVWQAFDLDVAALDLVREVKHNGFPVYLATNQTAYRMAYMHEAFPYDEVFDGFLVSAELGAMKPEKEYFLRALDRVSLAPDQVFFVDDMLANIETALSLGMHAEWHDRSGAAHLRTLLEEHGLL